MSTTVQRMLWIVGLVVALGAVNYTIAKHESTLRDGAVVRLALAPRDPRALMQGDYMDLRFAIADAVRKAAESAKVDSGRAVIRADENGVSQYARLDNGEPLSANERRIEFRVRGNDVRIVTNAFFFQEGTAQAYEAARFGEFRVNENGGALLVSLLDEKKQLIKPAPN
jgi:uncharacterized membrane-anchored protein